MSNRWVISWLVIDYWRWSMSNRWLIEAQKFCGLSITHRWHRLLIDVIDYLLMLLITHRWPIDYSSTIILRTKDTFLAFLYHFFSLVIFLSVLDVFFFITGVPVDEITPSQKECERLHQLQIQEPNICKKWPLRPCLKKADTRLNE